MNLLLNYNDGSEKIKEKLLELRNRCLFENTKQVTKLPEISINRIAECMAEIHSCDVDDDRLPLYDARWVIKYADENIEDDYKNDIISALKIMSQIERYNEDNEIIVGNNKFLSWNIKNNNWHETYETGSVGSYVWDIAAIINYMNDAEFSDIFLENYIKYSKKKPVIVELYANIYYVQVITAVLNKSFESVTASARKIVSENLFDTEIISYDTLIRLNLTGYK